MSQIPAPANKAAAPTAAVLIGIAAADDSEDIMDDVAPAGVGPAPIMDVGVGTPDVRALMLALEAPAKATDWVEAAGLGVAEVLLGFKTLRP